MRLRPFGTFMYVLMVLVMRVRMIMFYVFVQMLHFESIRGSP